MYFNSDQIKLAFIGVLAVALALGIGRFSYTPILPYMREALGLSSSEAGLIGSWNYIGYLAGSLSILFPFFSKQLKPSFIVACLISITSTGLTATTENFHFICLTRFINGFSGAVVLICGTSLIFSRLEKFVTPDLRLVHFSGFGLGMALSSLGVMFCAYVNLGWKEQWLVMVFICLLLFLPVLFLTPNPQKNTPQPSLKEITFRGSFILLCIGYACFGFGYIIYGTFIADLIRSSENFSGLENLAWLLSGIFAIPSALFWQKMGKMSSIDLSLLLSSLVCSVGALLLLFADHPNIVLTSCILYGFGIPGIVSLTLLEGRERFQGNITFSIAFLTMFFSVGQILGPYVSGNIIDYFESYFHAISLSAFSLALGGIFMLNPKRI